jgi:hypothetical protein
MIESLISGLLTQVRESLREVMISEELTKNVANINVTSRCNSVSPK